MSHPIVRTAFSAVVTADAPFFLPCDAGAPPATLRLSRVALVAAHAADTAGAAAAAAVPAGVAGATSVACVSVLAAPENGLRRFAVAALSPARPTAALRDVRVGGSDGAASLAVEGPGAVAFYGTLASVVPPGVVCVANPKAELSSDDDNYDSGSDGGLEF